MRLAFMGTPGFAAQVLAGLIHSRHQVVGVVTRPDKPRGRKRQMTPSPVSVLSDQHGVPVLKPPSGRNPEFFQQLEAWRPEVSVVAAFGFILPQAVLDVPSRGSINVHASLLPKYRGASPIQTAIINGEERTGITTMLMDAGLDTGDILLQRDLEIGPNETAGELEERLAALGSDLLLETLEALEAGGLRPEPQQDEQATLTRPMKPAAGNILWDAEARSIHNRIRGCTPRPGARLFFQGQPVRIWRSEIGPTMTDNCRAGMVAEVSPDGIVVTCSDVVSVRLIEVQPAGKSRMPADAWARGARIGPGTAFDTQPPATGTGAQNRSVDQTS